MAVHTIWRMMYILYGRTALGIISNLKSVQDRYTYKRKGGSLMIIAFNKAIDDMMISWYTKNDCTHANV